MANLGHIKKKKYNIKNVLFNNNNIIKSFEKNPINGGTPAMEKSSIVILSVVNELKLNSFKE